MTNFSFSEKDLSQFPALQLLVNLGYERLSPEQALKERNGKQSNVLLEGILRKQLEKINRIQYKGEEHLFSEANIQSAIEKIKNIPFDGLLKTNEEIYDLLTLGEAFVQTIEGDSKSHTLKYIDWENLAANVFHVTEEFLVERSGSSETARPDIVLFVNGIPLAVIECKKSAINVDAGISQMLRNQGKEYIPKLFIYTQLVMAVNKNEAKYATVDTRKKFWSVWKELEDSEDDVEARVNATEEGGGRLVTEQDRSIYSLCRPERLLEIVYGFTIFDEGVKKVARYQQFFLVRSALEKIKTKDSEGKREGGIVWHTQGSGKSITMVMLVRALALTPELKGMRIILVTDRKDLDKQLGNTFAACGLEKKRATTGRDLIRLIKDKTDIITTLINKFETAAAAEKYVDDSSDIVVLVDESHRTNFGELSANMRAMLPKACFIGFTGTPLLQKEKNSFARFGRLIEPSYPVSAAIKDKQVVPLIYEGMLVEIEQDKEAIDKWFERHTEGLSDKQKSDLKRKYSSIAKLSNTDGVVYMKAYHISKHFRDYWQGTGFKAQLVAPNKATALKYHDHLEQIGFVSSEVIISGPDMREGYEEVGAESTSEVVKFWKLMMEKYSNEEAYNQNIIDRFKNSDHPEVLIVVDKLLTGFDAPRNAVLYLCRPLKEHTLLQAIARVNRLHEGKDFGYVIDYANVLEELDKAMTTYEALAGFEESEIADFLISINREAEKLPKRHSELWDVFKGVKNLDDEEEYELCLADKERRNNFYGCLTNYIKSFDIARSSDKFITETPDSKLKDYKNDLKRFENLRRSVKLRYSDDVDEKEYEQKIKKLLDTNIKADDVTPLNEPVDIFDKKAFRQVAEGRGIYVTKTTAAKADIIAYATKRIIKENWDKDPAFYEKFSELIQNAIDNFKNKNITDSEYLRKVSEIRDEVAKPKRDDVPKNISNDEELYAYFGVIKKILEDIKLDGNTVEKMVAQIAVAIKEAIEKNWKVDFWRDSMAQKKMQNDIDDFLYDEIEAGYEIDLTKEQMDDIIRETTKVAKQHRN